MTTCGLQGLFSEPASSQRMCCVRVCVCAYVRTVLVHEPRNFHVRFFFSCSFLMQGGGEGVSGSSVQRSFPLHPRKTLPVSPALGFLETAGGAIIHIFTVICRDSPGSHTARAGPTPSRIISSRFFCHFCVWPAWHQHLHLMFFFHHHHMPTMSANIL